jgi:hypothetical protein
MPRRSARPGSGRPLRRSSRRTWPTYLADNAFIRDFLGITETRRAGSTTPAISDGSTRPGRSNIRAGSTLSRTPGPPHRIRRDRIRAHPPPAFLPGAGRAPVPHGAPRGWTMSAIPMTRRTRSTGGAPTCRPTRRRRAPRTSPRSLSRPRTPHPSPFRWAWIQRARLLRPAVECPLTCCSTSSRWSAWSWCDGRTSRASTGRRSDSTARAS